MEIAPSPQPLSGGWFAALETQHSYRHMLGVPGGIGISLFVAPGELGEVKSRYLLLDEESYNILSEYIPLEFKLSTSIGDLYINQSAQK